MGFLGRKREAQAKPDRLFFATDLHAILDRYSDRDTARIRRILAAQHGPLATRH